jgi:hypothetical protein
MQANLHSRFEDRVRDIPLSPNTAIWLLRIEMPLFIRQLGRKRLKSLVNTCACQRRVGKQKTCEHRATLHPLNGNAIDVALAFRASGVRANHKIQIQFSLRSNHFRIMKSSIGDKTFDNRDYGQCSLGAALRAENPAAENRRLRLACMDFACA